jgi:hypothetical protein
MQNEYLGRPSKGTNIKDRGKARTGPSKELPLTDLKRKVMGTGETAE